MSPEVSRKLQFIICCLVFRTRCLTQDEGNDGDDDAEEEVEKKPIYLRNEVLCTSHYWYVWSTLRLLKSSVIRVGLIKFLSPRCGRHICNINWIKADGEMFRLMEICAKLYEKARFKANALIFILWNFDVSVKYARSS